MGGHLSPTSSSRPPSPLAARPDSQPPTPFRLHFSIPEHTRHSTSTKVSPFQQYGTYVFLSSRISILQTHNDQALFSPNREVKRRKKKEGHLLPIISLIRNIWLQHSIHTTRHIRVYLFIILRKPNVDMSNAQSDKMFPLSSSRASDFSTDEMVLVGNRDKSHDDVKGRHADFGSCVDGCDVVG